MGHTNRGRQIYPWMDDGTAWSEAEMAVREVAAVLGLALLGLLRAVDAVVEAWPLPTSRPRK